MIKLYCMSLWGTARIIRRRKRSSTRFSLRRTRLLKRRIRNWKLMIKMMEMTFSRSWWIVTRMCLWLKIADWKYSIQMIRMAVRPPILRKNLASSRGKTPWPKNENVSSNLKHQIRSIFRLQRQHYKGKMNHLSTNKTKAAPIPD